MIQIPIFNQQYQVDIEILKNQIIFLNEEIKKINLILKQLEKEKNNKFKNNAPEPIENNNIFKNDNYTQENYII